MATALVIGANPRSLYGPCISSPHRVCTSSSRMWPAVVKIDRLGRSFARTMRKNAAECSANVREELGKKVIERRDLIVGGSSLAVLGALSGLATEPAEAVFCQDFTAAPSGLEYCDAKVGSGIAPEKGMLIKAHYTGRLTSGVVFDSSYERGRPLTFKVGVGEVIKGWDEGILGGEGIPPMQEGGKRSLRIPSSLAYGSRGAGCREGSCVIPPDSTLLFDVEFVGKA